MKKYIYITIGILFLFSSCETFELGEDLQNPNELTPGDANTDQVLNGIQTGFLGRIDNASNIGMNLTRQAVVNGGTNAAIYNNFVSPSDFNSANVWLLYYNVLAQGKQFIPAFEEKKEYYHAGMARTLMAYSLITMVDLYGDIPWTEALDETNLNPLRDPGESVYQVAIDMLLQAKDDFANPDTIRKPSADIYYNGSEALWIKFINSVLLKAYLNMNDVASIDALIADNNFIEPGQEFLIRYGNSTSDPDNRNPYWSDMYNGSNNTYMANNFMYYLKDSKGSVDPRTYYYFYRQVSDVTEFTNVELPCINEATPAHYTGDTPFCYLSDGYWGRDMGNGSGLPPDALYKTLWGAYPFGGKFDADDFDEAGSTDGLQGGGVIPVMLSSTVKFLKAEAMLRLGAAGDAKAEMADAIEEHMNFVSLFGPNSGGTNEITATSVSDYVTLVEGLYDAAGSDADKLEVLSTEFYIASYGNGMEAYNLYRRTGYPDLQPMLNPNPGAFPRSIYYPSRHTENNSNGAQKPNVEVKVFWDTNNTVLD